MSTRTRCELVAPGVHRLSTGRGLGEANVYLVQSGSAWTLIDTAWPHRAALIHAAAASLFGPDVPPAAILLTHIHLDHAGSALELARMWGVPVHVHPDELPLASDRLPDEPLLPLDRVILPVLRRLPRPHPARGQPTLADVVRSFDPAGPVPGLPGWRCVPTPGHSPGHVAFFRPADRVLLTGDAVLTVNLNSVPDLLLGRHRVAGPPWITTWNWPTATRSVARLAALEPAVLAGGHGRPISGAAPGLRRLAEELERGIGPTLGFRGSGPRVPGASSWRDAGL